MKISLNGGTKGKNTLKINQMNITVKKSKGYSGSTKPWWFWVLTIVLPVIIISTAFFVFFIVPQSDQITISVRIYSDVTRTEEVSMVSRYNDSYSPNNFIEKYEAGSFELTDVKAGDVIIFARSGYTITDEYGRITGTGKYFKYIVPESSTELILIAKNNKSD